MKRCSKCGEIKSFSEFHKDKTSKDGHAYHCKECACKRARQWNRDNKGRVAEYNKWRREGPGREGLLQAKREYYWSHREEILEYNRGYYQSNLEERRSANKRSYQRYREKRLEALRAYYRRPAGQEAHHRGKAKRRMRLMSAEQTLTIVEWAKLCKRYSVCIYCGHQFDDGEYKLTLDHVIPLSRGGSHTKENVLPVCFKCNRHKFNKLLGDWLPFDWYPDGINEYDREGIV